MLLGLPLMPSVRENKNKKAKGIKAFCGVYLITDGSTDGEGERTNIASAQVVLLPLVTEELKLSFLLLIQRITVTHLNSTVYH